MISLFDTSRLYRKWRSEMFSVDVNKIFRYRWCRKAAVWVCHYSDIYTKLRLYLLCVVWYCSVRIFWIFWVIRHRILPHLFILPSCFNSFYFSCLSFLVLCCCLSLRATDKLSSCNVDGHFNGSSSKHQGCKQVTLATLRNKLMSLQTVNTRWVNQPSCGLLSSES